MVMSTKKHNDCVVPHARIVLLLGAPGTGKGTQSALLASRFGIQAISSGAILREEAKRNTPAGFRLRQTMAAGALVDDATVCQAVASRIAALQRGGFATARTGETLILDGFPRTAGQARCLDQVLDGLGMPAPLVVHLVVPNDVLLRRLARRRQCAQCGAIYNLAPGTALAEVTSAGRCRIDGGALVERDDDSEGAVSRRLAEFETETLPVVDYYRRRDRSGSDYRRCGSDYRKVDGNRGVEEIAKELCDILLFSDTAVAA